MARPHGRPLIGAFLANALHKTGCHRVTLFDLNQIHPIRRDAFLVVRGKLERSNDKVDRACFRFDGGIIRAGYATRTPPSAGQYGHHRPRSMWRGYAHGEWYVRENSRPPCRQ